MKGATPIGWEVYLLALQLLIRSMCTGGQELLQHLNHKPMFSVNAELLASAGCVGYTWQLSTSCKAALFCLKSCSRPQSGGNATSLSLARCVVATGCGIFPALALEQDNLTSHEAVMPT